MPAQMEAKAVLSAEDRASAVLAMVARNFDRLNRAADQMHRADQRVGQINAFNTAMSRRADILARLGSGMSSAIGMIPGIAAAGGPAALAAAATAAAVAARHAYAENERAMTRVAITGDATRAQQERAALDIERLAQRTGIAQRNIREGAEELVAAGRKLPEAMAFLPSVAETAQAAGAEVRDIAKAADATGEHLGVAANDMSAAFDIMAAGGKAGKFELKDMARYLAEIAPMAKKAGMQGNSGLADLVSAFQMVRKEAGTSEEAATNLKNVFSKMYSEETGKKFKAAGVDLRKRLDAAEAKGENLLETFVNITREVTKTGKVKLPELFQDMQAQQGMSALLANMTEWKRLSREIATTSAGTVMRDLSRVTKDAQHGFDGLSNAAGRLWRNLGQSAPVQGAVEGVTRAMEKMNDAMEKSLRIKAAMDDLGVKQLEKPKTREEAEAEKAIERAKIIQGASPDYLTQYPDGGFHRTGVKPRSGAQKTPAQAAEEAFNARRAYQENLATEKRRAYEEFRRGERGPTTPAEIQRQKDQDEGFRLRDLERREMGGGTSSQLEDDVNRAMRSVEYVLEKKRGLFGYNAPSNGKLPVHDLGALEKELEDSVRRLTNAEALLKSGGQYRASEGDIANRLEQIRNGDFKAKVEPDQITAKIDGKVEAVTTVKIEASPNFITSIVSHVKSAIGPVFGSTSPTGGQANP